MADPQPWQEAVAEVWQLFKETDVKFKETQEELERRFKETNLQLKETDQKLRRLEGLFGMQWGRLMEALVEPAALKLFQERGIDVHHIFPRAKSQMDGRTLELDLLLENGDEVVVVAMIKEEWAVDQATAL